MSLEVKKWEVVTPDTPGVYEALPGLVATAVEALTNKGLPFCEEAINKKVYSTYTGVCKESTALLCGPCLLLVTFGETWWMPGFTLVEEAIYRFRPGNIKDTFDGLEQFARYSGMARIVVGSAAIRGRREEAYTRLLKSQGYHPTATQHTKEL